MALEKHKKLGLLVIILTILVLLLGLFRFVSHRLRYAVTNAVFVETDRLVYLGFQNVSGRLIKVQKEEGDKVYKGELVAQIDPRIYEKKLSRLKAQKNALKQKEKALTIEINRLRREVSLREAKAKKIISRFQEERQALLAKSKALEAEIKQLERDAKRFQRLYQRKLIPKHRLEEIETSLMKAKRQKEALLSQAEALLAAKEAASKDLALAQNQRKLIAAREKELAEIRHRIKALQAAVAEARLNLSFCRLKSPLDGIVAKRFHVSGDVVGPHEPIYAIVDPRDFYVLVLLEETKLHGIYPGCSAKVTLDAYPDVEFEGKVAEILPATAAKFALVPRDISAGEFTKVVQRVPVKVKITKGPLELLRVGLGGEIEIKRK